VHAVALQQGVDVRVRRGRGDIGFLEDRDQDFAQRMGVLDLTPHPVGVECAIRQEADEHIRALDGAQQPVWERAATISPARVHEDVNAAPLQLMGDQRGQHGAGLTAVGDKCLGATHHYSPEKGDPGLRRSD